MTPTQPYATFPMRGSGTGLLTRLATDQRISDTAFAVICAVTVITASAILIGIGMAGCVLSFALVLTQGKAVAIVALIIDALLVALIGTLGTVALFD